MSHRAPFLALFRLAFVPSLSPDAAQNKSPQDKPVAANAEQVKKFEAAIAPYVKKAREALPEAKKNYLAGLPQNQIFYVTIKLLRFPQDIRAGFCKDHFMEGREYPRNS
jgi:hypothetical protein